MAVKLNVLRLNAYSPYIIGEIQPLQRPTYNLITMATVYSWTPKVSE